MRTFPRWLVLGMAAFYLCLPITAETASRKQPRKRTESESSVYIPKDLEDCFAELDKLWSAKQREEFRRKSEDDLISLHFEVGMWMRNRWRLWAGSRLQGYFAGRGVPHPESISSIIITSYWRRENHQEVRLEEQIATDKAEWEQQRKENEAEEVRTAQALAKISKLMLGFEYQAGAPPKLVMPQRAADGIRARFMARFRGGVLLTVREVISSEGLKDTYRLVPHFLDLKEQRIHSIQFPEMPEIDSSVVAGDWLWVLGRMQGELRLLALDDKALTYVSLPRTDEVPQLGISGDQVLLVYSSEIFRRESGEWKPVYSGDLKLPFSGPPPRQYGDKIYFRDEGSGEDDKQLCYLELGPVPRLAIVWQETGLVGPNGPRWENTFGYCVLSDGTLWTTFGESTQAKSVVRRQPSGEYRIAVINNDVALRGDLLGRTDDVGPTLTSMSSSGWKQMPNQNANAKSAGLSISGIVAKSDDDLIGIADTGLFEIRGKQIQRLVSFRNTHQLVPIESGLLHWNWDPTDILLLADNSYLITGTFGGIYLLQQDDSKRWHFKSLDERLGKPLFW